MDLKQYCNELNINYAKALLYKFALENKEEGVLDYFLSKFLDEEISLYKINLTKVVNGELVFKEFEDDEFNDFIAQLKEAGLGPSGFPNVEADYIIFKPNSTELKKAFLKCRKKYTTQDILFKIYEFYTKDIKYKPAIDKFINDNIC